LGLDRLDFPSWAQGILITDGALPDNPIIYANLGFQQLTGYDREEVVVATAAFFRVRKPAGRRYRPLVTPFATSAAIMATY